MAGTPPRKLAVILHADVVGSTLLVQKDEGVAHERIQAVFQRLSQTTKSYGGIAHEIRGDALVAEFSRASDAVCAALAFQADNTSRFEEDDLGPNVRVGISLGEVVIADGTVTGAGVVLAQRLEQVAQPGAVVVQGSVSETVPTRMPFEYESLGEQTLKGFEQPVRAFVVSLRSGGDIPAPDPAPSKSDDKVATTDTAEENAGLELPDKPSIAVLAFTNISGDPEQEYFSDGISEDIITELSRFRTLFVIARNSSFRFKGASVDVREVGEELGVQYIVEGSVRRVGTRVRITAQLVETDTGNHIWAERYDRELDDIFELQDEVTRNIVAVLPGRVQEDVVDRALRKPTENMKAYELMLQGKAYRDQLSAEGNAKARACCEKAIELDPRYARAYMYLSDSYVVDIWLGLADEESSQLALQLAREAAALDGNDVYIQDHLGFGYLSQGMWKEAEAQFDKTLAKIVNEAESMAWCGYAFLLLGQPEKAREVALEARRLDPLHPPTLDWILGQIYYYEERYEEVVRLLIGEALLNSLAHGFLVGAYAHLGLEDEARESCNLFVRERRLEFASRNIVVEEDTVESLAGSFRTMWRNQASWEQFADGLRKAGLPG
jgi:adenylate cyclase